MTPHGGKSNKSQSTSKVDVGAVTTPTPPDHPRTDPGDGRTECDVCGKWVFECIHSCKGIPVTEAARKRAYERQPDVIGFGQWESCGGPCCGGDVTSPPPRPRRTRPPRRELS